VSAQESMFVIASERSERGNLRVRKIGIASAENMKENLQGQSFLECSAID